MFNRKIQPLLYLIDLFCGAGGVTTGFVKARYKGQKIAKVIACVNHDPNAIKSHAANHKRVKHYREDIKTLDLTELIAMVTAIRLKDPSAKIVLWASLECTNFSNAKGGLSREADSRMLGDEMYRYIEALSPDYFMVENVKEFLDWGPVRIKAISHENHSELIIGKNGKYVFIPVEELKETFFRRWKNRIIGYGYQFEDNNEGTLNAADYGAIQSRKRYFAVFAKYGLPIFWPEPTHTKDPARFLKKTGKRLKKWKPVKIALDLQDHGISMFLNPRLKSEKSKARIYEGLIRQIAGGKSAFIQKYNSNRAKDGSNPGCDIDKPSHTITTQVRMALVTPQFMAHHQGKSNDAKINDPSPTILTKDKLALITPFLVKNFSGHPESKNLSVNDPAATVTTIDHHTLATAQYLICYHGKLKDDKSIDQISGTITTKDDFGLVTSQFLKIDYTTGGTHKSINEPSNALTQVNKSNLVTCEPFITDNQYSNGSQSINDPSGTVTASRHYHYIVNPQWGITNNFSLENPSHTLIAGMDAATPWLITTESGHLAIQINETDSHYTKLIKEFMALYGIIDIKTRMLKISELLLIQGFPKDYILKGNKEDQKRFIGNAVEVNQAKVLAEAIYKGLIEADIISKAA